MKFKDIQSDCPWMVPNYGVNKKNACSVVSTPTHLNTCRKERCGFWAWQAKYGERKEMTEKSNHRRVYIIPIDDKETECLLEGFLRSNGFRFSIPAIPPKNIFGCDTLEEVKQMGQSRKEAEKPDGDYHI